jgi:hypothetical protein
MSDRRSRRGLIAALVSAAAVSLIAPALGQAATTIGQLDNSAQTAGNCSSGVGGRLFAQASTNGGAVYQVPAGSVITSWATNARQVGGAMALKVLAKGTDLGGGNSSYTVLQTSETQTTIANQVNQFRTRVPVPDGGTVGLHLPNGAFTQKCFFDPNTANNAQNVVHHGDSPTGAVGSTFNTDVVVPNARLNLQVTYEPDADLDGFGDETQDLCPTNAATQGACPAAVLPDVIKPVFSRLRFSRGSFAAAKSGAAFTATKKKGKKKKSAPVGSKVSYTLSEAASVTFTFERKTSGRRVSGKCKTKTRKNRKKPKCDLYRKVTGSFTVPGRPGPNSFTFRGRVGGKTLKTGNYRLTGTATDTARNTSTPTKKAFKIVK